MCSGRVSTQCVEGVCVCGKAVHVRSLYIGKHTGRFLCPNGRPRTVIFVEIYVSICLTSVSGRGPPAVLFGQEGLPALGLHAQTVTSRESHTRPIRSLCSPPSGPQPSSNSGCGRAHVAGIRKTWQSRHASGRSRQTWRETQPKTTWKSRRKEG